MGRLVFENEIRKNEGYGPKVHYNKWLSKEPDKLAGYDYQIGLDRGRIYSYFGLYESNLWSHPSVYFEMRQFIEQELEGIVVQSERFISYRISHLTRERYRQFDDIRWVFDVLKFEFKLDYQKFALKFAEHCSRVPAMDEVRPEHKEMLENKKDFEILFI